jgi:hypothetical protein
MSFIPLGILAASGAGGGGSFESIATATGTGSSGVITFNSIPSTYKHLQIRLMSRSTSTAATARRRIALTFNSDTGNNYADHTIQGQNGSVYADAAANFSQIRVESSSFSETTAGNIMGVGLIDIHDYASTTKNKTVRFVSACETNTSVGAINLSSGLWINTNAITSITLTLGTPNFTTTSVFSLYGIKG